MNRCEISHGLKIGEVLENLSLHKLTMDIFTVNGHSSDVVLGIEYSEKEQRLNVVRC